MSGHHDDTTIDPLDMLLKVADVRTEQALQESLELRAGLAAITAQRDEESASAVPSRGDDVGGSLGVGTFTGPEDADILLATKSATLTLTPSKGEEEFDLTEAEIRLLAQIAAGVTADVAARQLELSARTLRRRLRAICDRLEVNTPIEAVIWAARRQLI
ncbi:hypothetical protein GCM10010182_79240 [Actinomadura cremea]|nr:hypothetical protein GCM10010182_79240 [Actinomadura cremea]